MLFIKRDYSNAIEDRVVEVIRAYIKILYKLSQRNIDPKHLVN